MLTFDYYQTIYGGLEMSREVFEDLSKRAERKIQALTGYQVRSVVQLPDSIRELYLKAICAQVEYLLILGVENALGVTHVAEAKIGHFSYVDGKKTSRTAKLGLESVAPEVMDYLTSTGLLYKGVGTR